MSKKKGDPRVQVRSLAFSGSILAIVLLMSALVVAACGPTTLSVRGLVVEVRADDLIEWESIMVRAGEGVEIEFFRGASIDLRFWRASHLREHMVLGSPVTVEYKTQDGFLVATTIHD